MKKVIQRKPKQVVLKYKSPDLPKKEIKKVLELEAIQEESEEHIETRRFEFKPEVIQAVEVIPSIYEKQATAIDDVNESHRKLITTQDMAPAKYEVH